MELSWRIGDFVEVFVSLRRIQAFLEHPPLDPQLVYKGNSSGSDLSIEVHGANFAWDTKPR